MLLDEIEVACANTILNRFLSSDDPITHLKLQKLYYFSTGHHLAQYDEYLSAHNFQAWPFGPVLPNLFSALSHHRDKPIDAYLKFKGKVIYYDSGSVSETVAEVVSALGSYTAWQLSDKSHAVGGPWHETLKEKDFKEYKRDIQWDCVRQYFEKTSLNAL